MLDEQYRGTNWAVAMGEDALKELQQTWATALDYRHWLDYAAEAGKEKLDAMFARPRDVFDRAQSQGLGVGESLYQAIGIGISDRIGLTSVLSAWWGEDPVTLEKLSNTQRIFHAVKGTLELIATGPAFHPRNRDALWRRLSTRYSKLLERWLIRWPIPTPSATW